MIGICPTFKDEISIEKIKEPTEALRDLLLAKSDFVFVFLKCENGTLFLRKSEVVVLELREFPVEIWSLLVFAKSEFRVRVLVTIVVF